MVTTRSAGAHFSPLVSGQSRQIWRDSSENIGESRLAFYCFHSLKKTPQLPDKVPKMIRVNILSIVPLCDPISSGTLVRKITGSHLEFSWVSIKMKTQWNLLRKAMNFEWVLRWFERNLLRYKKFSFLQSNSGDDIIILNDIIQFSKTI